MSEVLDVAIIGCGMSGLSAGIRLAHFGKQVCIFERHNAPGGLNGFYSLEGRKYDVGLHAVTNFVPPGAKGTPLVKLLRQLRIDRDELDLCPQLRSRIEFPGCRLHFTNELGRLEAEVAERFPKQVDGFRRLVVAVREFQDPEADGPWVSARGRLREFIQDPVLEDMLLCPLMFYGSPTADDLEWWLFAVLFRSLYLEGFARPFVGVRQILRVLLQKLREAGGRRRMRCGVRRLLVEGNQVTRLILESGEEVLARQVLSTIGWPETLGLMEPAAAAAAQPAGAAPETAQPGCLSFTETITVLRDQPASFGWGEDTIVFFSRRQPFDYRSPEPPVDVGSGVLVIPNNYDYGPDRNLDEGVVRVTSLANPAYWNSLDPEAYRAEKLRWFQAIQDAAFAVMPPVDVARFREGIVATDMFTPRTIERFTSRRRGAVYGSPRKIRGARTGLGNLYLCGTDQGYLGIVGSLLSGVIVANQHLLR